MDNKKEKQGTFQSSAVRFMIVGIGLVIMPGSFLFAQNKSDSGRILQKVTVTGEKKQNPYVSVVPVQVFNHETLLQINAETIADAAKYFSGVLIKDYGGVGGLKTISVRSLGGLNTRSQSECSQRRNI